MDTMSKSRKQANRKNALHSTGPKTPRGKAKSSRNAVKHGLCSLSPVVAPFEREDDWEAFRTGILESLSPVGQLETELAERVAFHSWRLRRIARYERERIGIAQESVKEDVDADLRQGLVALPDRSSEDFGRGFDERAKLAREAERNAKTCFRLLSPDDEDPVKIVDAWLFIYSLAEAVKKDSSDLAAACLPDGGDPQNFNDWTAVHLRRAIDVAAQQAERKPSELARQLYWDALDTRSFRRAQMQRLRTELDRRRRERILPNDKTIDQLCRFEAHSNRIGIQSLHELQRLQAGRQGAGLPIAPALDINLNVSPGEESA